VSHEQNPGIAQQLLAGIGKGANPDEIAALLAQGLSPRAAPVASHRG
jgi:hypothetical protein